MSNRPRLSYLDVNCELTLRAGIAELRNAEGATDDVAGQVADELRQDLDVHDAIHVLFACPTTLRGEILAHLWTLFGTSARFADLSRVNLHADHRQVLAEIGHARLFKSWLLAIPLLCRVAWRSRAMSRRFPVERLVDFLDHSLKAIRDEFGIQILAHPEASNGRAGAALRFVQTRVPVAS